MLILQSSSSETSRHLSLIYTKRTQLREMKVEPYLCCGRDSNLSFVGSKTLGISECRVPRSDLSYTDSAITPSTDSWVSFKSASRWAVIILYWMLQDSGTWVSAGASALSPSLQLVLANVLWKSLLV